MEDGWLGKATERLFLPLVRLFVPEVVDYNLPVEGVFHNLCIVKIKKRYPGHAQKVMNALWGLGQMMFTKIIIVVDDWVDVQDLQQVLWVTANNIDPERDILFTRGPVDVLDHASRAPGFGSKMGIDATKKMPEEGFSRVWPPVITMTPEVKTRVDALWKDLVCDGDDAPPRWRQEQQKANGAAAGRVARRRGRLGRQPARPARDRAAYSGRGGPRARPLRPRRFVHWENDVLLVQNKDGSWTFPGGRLEERETTEEALTRELWEEARARARPGWVPLAATEITFVNRVPGRIHRVHPTFLLWVTGRVAVLSDEAHHDPADFVIGRRVAPVDEARALLPPLEIGVLNAALVTHERTFSAP
jgi:8-oxo-dGTP pyrophosphatase MutT (NUDIX family)